MLGLVAAQLKHRAEAGLISQRPVWVDVCVISLDSQSFANVNRLAAELVTSNLSQAPSTCFSDKTLALNR